MLIRILLDDDPTAYKELNFADSDLLLLEATSYYFQPPLLVYFSLLLKTQSCCCCLLRPRACLLQVGS